MYCFATVFVLMQEFQGPMKPPLPRYPLPTPRVFPTLTPLIDPELVGDRFCSHGPIMTQRMVMLWGKKREQEICNEAWMLDMESFIWMQVAHFSALQSLATFSLALLQ